MGEPADVGERGYQTKGKVTRRERFLTEMDAVIPWATLTALIAPYYATPGRGRRPLPLETMLRVCFLQQWFDLSDPQAEDMLYDSDSMRRFARVELGEDTVPDESTILRLRHLLERHQVTSQMFAAVRELLEAKRLLLKAGTIVDATTLAAPSSTKNAMQARDPEMRQTRKGKQWHFGTKVHVGTDTRGRVHSLTTTDAAQADITQVPALLHGQEATLYGDKAYWKADHREQWEASGGKYRVNKRGERTAYTDRINRARSRVRARGEHAFHVVKRLWGFASVLSRQNPPVTTHDAPTYSTSPAPHHLFRASLDLPSASMSGPPLRHSATLPAARRVAGRPQAKCPLGTSMRAQPRAIDPTGVTWRDGAQQRLTI